MAGAETRIIHTTINVPFATAYEFAWHPENFSRWAAGLSDNLHQDEDGGWVFTGPREAVVRFTPHNELGILDHTVKFADIPLIAIPLRMLPNGEGTEVELVLFRLPQMSDAEFEEDATAVGRDLAVLKAVLEASV